MEARLSPDLQDISGGGSDVVPPPAAKRIKRANSKFGEATDAVKLQQMKISEDLSCFIAKCIIADPETWGIMLTSSHGKSNVQKKFIQFLSEHPNPLTNGKSTTIINKIKYY